MLINNQPPGGEYRHNYVRLVFMLGTILLFIGYIVAGQILERGNNGRFILSIDVKIGLLNCLAITVNGTLRPEDLVVNDIIPSDWVYRSLNALNYLWQVKDSLREVFEK